MCSSQQSISNTEKTQVSAKSLPEIKQLLTSDQRISFSSQKIFQNQTSDERAQLIRSRKSILKRGLSNSIQIRKSILNINSKQENLTAASLKDLDCDQYVAFKNGKFQSKDSVFGSIELFIIETETTLEESFEQKYSLSKKIGQGAHSTVYKSLCKIDNKQYAFKKIKNVSFENQKKLKNLFKMVKHLQHQNIIQFHEFFFDEDKKTAFIVMEYCQYSDLRSQISKRSIAGNKFTNEEIQSIMKQVTSVLKYLHAEGICHRDLKPQNILFNSQTGQIKVIDLDICGVKSSKSQNFDMWTNTGTLIYRAPQSFEIGYSQKADIWSLGTIIYQLICGQVPLQTEYEKDFLFKIKNEEVNFDRLKTSKKIKLYLEKCLQKDPKKRISASEMLDLLSLVPKDDSSISKEYKFSSKDVSKYFDDSQLNKVCLGNILKFTY